MHAGDERVMPPESVLTGGGVVVLEETSAPCRRSVNTLTHTIARPTVSVLPGSLHGQLGPARSLSEGEGGGGRGERGEEEEEVPLGPETGCRK